MAVPHYVRFDYEIVPDGSEGVHSVQTKMLVYGSHCLVEGPDRDDYRLALLEKMDEMGWSFKMTISDAIETRWVEGIGFITTEKWIFRKETTR